MRVAALIGALRRHFGSRFVGGLTRTEFTQTHYPHFLSDHSQARVDYVQLVRSSAIAVSSVGLHGSNPWKLAEYLAGGAAIVSEPLRFAIPESLDGTATFFTDVDGCLAACDDLLSNARVLHEHHERSREYWRKYARPDALLRRRLTEEFESRSRRAHPGPPRTSDALASVRATRAASWVADWRLSRESRAPLVNYTNAICAAA